MKILTDGGGVNVRFLGRAIEAVLASNENVFEVFVDGLSRGVINTTSSQRQYPLASNLSSGTIFFFFYDATEEEGIAHS